MFGIKITKSSTLSEIGNQLNSIKKRLDDSQRFRPTTDNRTTHLYGQDDVLIPLLPFEEDFLYELALYSDVLRTGLNTLRRMLFRRGEKIISKHEVVNLVQEAKLKQLIKKANSNKQGLLDVAKQFEWDLNVHDNGYLIAIKDYYFDFDGKIIDELTEPKEIIRGSPIRMKIVSDFQGNLGVNPEGKKIFTSPDDRGNVYTEEQAIKYNFMNPKTKKEMRQVFYRGEKEHGKFVYYFEDEVWHQSKHNPSLIYGFSPIFAIWQKVLALIQQDRYILTAYKKGRPPRGLLLIATSNYQSLTKAWEELKSAAREDPHAIQPLAYENANGNGAGATWIDLMRPLTEMQYIESRNEMRRAILSIYGLMPMMSGDIETSGGLNNENLQIEVSNIAIEEGQAIYNDLVFPWILKQFGINDFELILQEPEEKDELEDEKLLQARIQNAQAMKNMGFDVKYYPKESTFEYSEESKDLSQNLFSLSKEDKIQKLINFEKSLIPNIEIKKDLEEKLIQNLKEKIWDKNFEGLNTQTSEKIKSILIDGIVEGFSLNEVTKKLIDLGINKVQAETIARTESTNIQNTAREELFKDLNIEKVRWFGPSDNRTSGLCKEIKEKTKNGVTMNELKEIIRETSKKYGLESRGLVAHPNERHTILPI